MKTRTILILAVLAVIIAVMFVRRRASAQVPTVGEDMSLKENKRSEVKQPSVNSRRTTTVARPSRSAAVLRGSSRTTTGTFRPGPANPTTLLMETV